MSKTRTAEDQVALRRSRYSERRPLGICASLIACLSVMLIADCAVAQQSPKPVRIGYLDAFTTPTDWTRAFRQSLINLGHVENRTFVIDWRSAAGRVERLPDLASELVQLKPSVIVAETPGATRAAKNATATIPIVMVLVSDPVGLGLVASLARPGGNVTGLSNLSAGLAGKRLELLAEIVPGLTRVGVVGSTASRPAKRNYLQLEAAASNLGLAVELFEVRRPEDFDAAFVSAHQRVRGVIVLNNAVMRANREAVAGAAMRHLVPAVHPDAATVAKGGLISYATNIPDLHRRAAIYVDKILKGQKPANLPIEQPTKFTLAVNLRSAKALGITIPPSILLQATEVIE